MSEAEDLTVITVGHSNVTRDQFLQLLLHAGVEVLVDVRTSPYSRYAPQFNEPDLKAAAQSLDLKFVPMGEQLGGRPRGVHLYDPEGHVVYARVAREDFFRAGIERLVRGARTHRIAIMCSEENPVDCHRRLLVGRVLVDEGVTVLHLRGDGRLQTEPQVRAEEIALHPDRIQIGMFTSEEDTWRSTRSVSPNARPQSSSARSSERESDSW
jgi:uncharacterized protein (DUF488 family)